MRRHPVAARQVHQCLPRTQARPGDDGVVQAKATRREDDDRGAVLKPAHLLAIRTGENGAVVRLGDTAAFVAAAAQVAGDLPRCRALGEQARMSARALDWDGIVVQFESVPARVMLLPGTNPGHAFASIVQSSV